LLPDDRLGGKIIFASDLGIAKSRLEYLFGLNVLFSLAHYLAKIPVSAMWNMALDHYHRARYKETFAESIKTGAQHGRREDVL